MEIVQVSVSIMTNLPSFSVLIPRRKKKEWLLVYLVCAVQMTQNVILAFPTWWVEGKNRFFPTLKDRFKQRIDNWSVRHLSQGGKKVFIKAILQSIPTYTMVFFYYLSHYVLTWRVLLRIFSGKRVVASRVFTVRVSKAKYYLNSNFINAQLGNLPSLTWKSVWATKGLLKSGLCWRVGRGVQISVWDDLWLPRVDANRLSNITNNEELKLVSDLIDATNKTWKPDLIANTFHADIAQKILQIPLAEAAHDDFQVWRGEPSDEFSVRSIYKLLQEAQKSGSECFLSPVSQFGR
ncbi:reverse transcriptase [Gossypium australe]|uniref:Reverse transcriptase n=1 Tax=Gossypium australe TaxID=47621 RepID=A0A5B6X5W6_9ROSI|nr:reverse transcriptase [Gossypium australe]